MIVRNAIKRERTRIPHYEPCNYCDRPGFYPKFVEKPEIFPETRFLDPGLKKSHRRGESVVFYNTGRVNTVARKNAVNSRRSKGMARSKVRQMSRSTLEQEILLNRITNRIRNSLELQEILTTTAREIRSFLGSDRVKVYRFESDGSGEVIAESINGDNLPSLLGLRFPASDIPNSARQMFVKARQRVIVDVQLQHQTINRLDCPETGKTLAVEDIAILL